MGDAHGGEHGHQVESLPECELLVVAIILPASAVLDEVLRDLGWSRLHLPLFPAHTCWRWSMRTYKRNDLVHK